MITPEEYRLSWERDQKERSAMIVALQECREVFESLPASQHERTTDAYQLVLTALKKAGVA